MDSDTLSSENLSIHQRLNLQTAKVSWHELQRLFATGTVVVVEQGTDLVKSAESFVANDSQHVAQLLSTSVLRKAEMSDAERWHNEEAVLWAVVVAPWVLVQDI